MSDAALSDLPLRVLGLARTIVGASRNRPLYPADHPAAGASLTRPTAATRGGRHRCPPGVAFERLLKQDLSGYPEKIGSRTLNLCTMVVSIADALRSIRIYRQGLSTDRIKAIMAQQDSTSFDRILLRRCINLMDLYTVGTIVRLATDRQEPFLLNTWEGDANAVVAAVDPDVAGFGPRSYSKTAEEVE